MKKQYLFCLVLILAPVLFGFTELLSSPTWGFRLYLPEGYELIDGDGKNAFSFASSVETSLDLIVYTDKPFAAVLAEEIETKLSSRGKRNAFTYNNREAAIMELNFTQGGNSISGWALCLELDTHSSAETLSSA